MSFDPNAFTLQLIQSLGQQIGQGVQQVRENEVLGPIQQQLQQNPDPQEILNLITQAQANPNLGAATQQRLAQLAPSFAGQVKQRQQQEQQSIEQQRKTQQAGQEKVAVAKEIERRTGQDFNELIQQPANILKAILDAELAGDKKAGEETAKANVVLANEIRAGSRKAKDRLGVVGQLAQLGAENATGPVSARRFFGLFGAPDIGENPTQGAINTARTFLLDFVKDTFGGRLNQTEVKLIENAIPGVNDKPEVFKAKLAIWQKFMQKAAKGGDVINEIIADNNGRIPGDKDIGFLFDQRISDDKNDLFADIQALEGGAGEQPAAAGFTLEQVKAEKARRARGK